MIAIGSRRAPFSFPRAIAAVHGGYSDQYGRRRGELTCSAHREASQKYLNQRADIAHRRAQSRQSKILADMFGPQSGLRGFAGDGGWADREQSYARCQHRGRSGMDTICDARRLLPHPSVMHQQQAERATIQIAGIVEQILRTADWAPIGARS